MTTIFEEFLSNSDDNQSDVKVVRVFICIIRNGNYTLMNGGKFQPYKWWAWFELQKRTLLLRDMTKISVFTNISNNDWKNGWCEIESTIFLLQVKLKGFIKYASNDTISIKGTEFYLLILSRRVPVWTNRKENTTHLYQFWHVFNQVQSTMSSSIFSIPG